MDIHLVSIGEKSNPKPNPIGFGVANPKIMREKSSPDPNPKSTDMQLESEPLSSFIKACCDRRPDSRSAQAQDSATS